MTVYLLAREEQKEYGSVDTDVVAAYRDRTAVGARVSAEGEPYELYRKATEKKRSWPEQRRISRTRCCRCGGTAVYRT